MVRYRGQDGRRRGEVGRTRQGSREGGRRLTLWVILEDVDSTVGVDGNDVQIRSIGQEICRHDVELVG